jgi:phosphatidylserine/phosphatidylglycerophosphate/cardiolipin synthase-like enzyme
MSIVPLHRMSRAFPLDDNDLTLESFAAQMVDEFPNLRFSDQRSVYRPLNYLIQALNKSQHFIHIATESIDVFFIGMLAMKYYESDIEIHIIVWHPQKIYPKLKRLMEHSIFMRGYEHGIRPFTRGILVETVSEAHQKLIVLDGRVAFYGSANTTLDGWTRSGELIQFTTDKGEIQNLNRDLFSNFVVKKRLSYSKKRNKRS